MQFYGTDMKYFEEKGCPNTAREIAHQPDMWRNLIPVMNENRQKINDFMDKAGKGPVRCIMTGAGSSGFVGRAVAGFVSKEGGIFPEAIHTTDIVSAPEAHLAPDIPTILVSFARSGNSPESVGAVEYARKIVKNLYEVSIVCDGESKLAKNTNGLVLVMPKGTNDKAFAMTSSVSTMMLAGYSLFCRNDFDKISNDITALADEVEKNSLRMDEAAKTCAKWGFERAWYLASGPFAALAQEGALKMMELTNGAVVAGSNSATEFRHGPKTVLNPKTLTVHFISGDPFTAKYDLDLLNELYRERDGNKVVAIAKDAQADLLVPYSPGREICVGIQGLVIMQLLSMYTSIELGVRSDNPSPSGLVNRVVQGVTVYPYREV